MTKNDGKPDREHAWVKDNKNSPLTIFIVFLLTAEVPLALGE